MPDKLNPFAVLPVVAKYASTIQAVADMMPEAERAYEEFQALLAKHKTLIARAETLTPQIQAFVREILPAIQQ